MIIKGCLFLHKNICCGYSLESPWRGDSNQYPQHTFLLSFDEIMFQLSSNPYYSPALQKWGLYWIYLVFPSVCVLSFRNLSN